MDGQRLFPITLIPEEACCIHCDNYNNRFLAVSGTDFIHTPFEQSHVIIPLQEKVLESRIQESDTLPESIILGPPTILPTPSPYTRMEIHHEDTNPAVIVPRPAARCATTTPQSTSRPTEAAPQTTAIRSTTITPQTPARPAVTSNQPVSKNQVLYRVQIGAFQNTDNVQRNLIKLRSAGFNPILERSGTYTRVIIPRIEAQNLTATINRLNNIGFMDTWVRNEL